MKDEHAPSLEAQYAQALEHERAALHALQALRPGSDGSARAWQDWSEAIHRTNEAWRELSRHTLGQHPHLAPATARVFARGAVALSR
ncbi:MAG: hypothetical protein Q8R01_03705 [Ramlibacter sp.]|nr:hypothetical protein [Ramlibacter sp.]